MSNLFVILIIYHIFSPIFSQKRFIMYYFVNFLTKTYHYLKKILIHYIYTSFFFLLLIHPICKLFCFFKILCKRIFNIDIILTVVYTNRIESILMDANKLVIIGGQNQWLSMKQILITTITISTS